MDEPDVTLVFMVVHQDEVIEMAALQGVDLVSGGNGQYKKAHLLVEFSDERLGLIWTNAALLKEISHTGKIPHSFARRNSLLDAEFRSEPPVQAVATASRAQEKTTGPSGAQSTSTSAMFSSSRKSCTEVAKGDCTA